MKRIAMNFVLASALFAPAVMIGCDRTVSEEKSVQKTSDGTTVTDKEKTTQSPDGSSKSTAEHKVDKPN